MPKDPAFFQSTRISTSTTTPSPPPPLPLPIRRPQRTTSSTSSSSKLHPRRLPNKLLPLRGPLHPSSPRLRKRRARKKIHIRLFPPSRRRPRHARTERVFLFTFQRKKPLSPSPNQSTSFSVPAPKPALSSGSKHAIGSMSNWGKGRKAVILSGRKRKIPGWTWRMVAAGGPVAQWP